MSSGLTEKFYERQIVGNTVGLDYWSAFDEPYPSSEEKQNELDEPEKTEEPVKKDHGQMTILSVTKDQYSSIFLKAILFLMGPKFVILIYQLKQPILNNLFLPQIK